jgi:hypothetical protein
MTYESRMKLGMKKGWALHPPTPVAVKVQADLALARAQAPPPLSYGRLMAVKRVDGFNDIIGDCVQTGIVNYMGAILGRQGIYTPIPDQLPLEIYKASTGYNGDASTDQGTDP